MTQSKDDHDARIAALEAELAGARELIDMLQESNHQLNALIENTDDFILFSDETGGPLFWNSAYAAIMKAMLGIHMKPGLKPHKQLEDPEARAWWDGLHLRVLSGEKFCVEFQHEVSPDDVRTFEISFNPLIEGGKVLGFSEYTREITDRKRAEAERSQLQQQLLQSQKMEALGKLAGGMAHDFNNLLAVILGTAELLTARASDERERGRVGRIVKMAQRGRDLTGKLLAFARREQLETNPTPLGDLVRDILDILRSSAPKRVHIDTSLADESARADVAAGQVTLALLNICLNACDAMPEGGTLTLSTEVVSRWPKRVRDTDRPERRPWCHIRIADTGSGIPAEVLDRVFEPFFTTKPRGQGTGLGLSVSLGIIESHGGWIDVTSEADQGTIMDVWLPTCAAEVEEAQPPARHEANAAAGWRVLAVDDEPDFLETVADQLRTLGHAVKKASGGAQALEIYREDPAAIDVVLLDILMPEMDGRATFTALRETNPDVKVVLCSGFSLKGQAEEMLAEGAQAFLQKPFDFSDLENVLERVLHETRRT